MATSISTETSAQVLEQAGVRATAVRLMVWKCVTDNFADTFSLGDLEDALPSVDRSTLFRTLTTLAGAHLIHEIDDGSGSQKYCLCRCHDMEHRGHVHLTCSRCHHTFCLKEVKIPSVPIPDGFQVEEMEYVVKGVCKHCAAKEV